MQTTSCCDQIIENLRRARRFTISDNDCNDLKERNVKACVDLINLDLKATTLNQRLFYSSTHYTGVMDGDEEWRYRFRVLPNSIYNRLKYRFFSKQIIDT
jgi:hypothetical protein